MSKALCTIVYSAFFYCPAVAILFQLKRFNCIVLMIVSMEYKRLSDRRFCALKYNIALQGFCVASDSFFYCYSIVILLIY